MEHIHRTSVNECPVCNKKINAETIQAVMKHASMCKDQQHMEFVGKIRYILERKEVVVENS
ncbi:hypothetical protein [Acidianus sp. RZ1]|uniref:hypothetical protein n=1 Tax=Acidianus sp. RZ1 TaxID=1540082 RepID=UPI001491632D|nr:hypothetical protein [Acidianus sp. RZ1]NON61753.1 hypothetical protein [Acidianus sp. RZ1]